MSEPADVVETTNDLAADIARLEAQGFRLDMIYPADEPRVAQLSGNGQTIRLEGPTPMTQSVDYNPDELVVTRGGDWGEGRAGMHYRDLIPNRLGGTVIASHIRITEPGPVPDYVHHHDIHFQMIYCRAGRVQVVYEDQGEAFWMEEGDCVLQPPHIRHRVLASDDGCEVVEIASPAEHPTFVEHQITLPTNVVDPDRDFGGQRFSFDRSSNADWVDDGLGWLTRSTGIAEATNGLASVTVTRSKTTSSTRSGSHGSHLFLLYVLNGTAEFSCDGSTKVLTSDDCVAIPRGQTWEVTSDTTELFEALVIEMTQPPEPSST